ncbi:MAG: DUF3817 domain-containing protein [Solirubrobacteraceae bacterium]
MGAALGPAGLMTPLFRLLRALSWTNSVAFSALLVCWLTPGLEGPTAVFGWLHGCLWIVLSLLSIVAVRRGDIPFWLAVIVAVVGGVGPFAGTAGFVVETRRREARASLQSS